MKIITGVLDKHINTGEVRAFGSRCKGTNREYSDLDLAIVCDRKIPENTLENIKDDFSESELVFRVDVLDYNRVSDNFRKIIDSRYEMIFRTRKGKIIMSLELCTFEKAINSFEKSLSDYQLAETTNLRHFLETLRAGVIQNFEFTYELSWKLIKRWVEENDSPIRVDGVTRIELFRVGAENCLINDVPKWMSFHKARNETSHIYAEETAERVFCSAKEFLPYVKKLHHCLKERNE